MITKLLPHFRGLHLLQTLVTQIKTEMRSVAVPRKCNISLCLNIVKIPMIESPLKLHLKILTSLSVFVAKETTDKHYAQESHNCQHILSGEGVQYRCPHWGRYAHELHLSSMTYVMQYNNEVLAFIRNIT
jgi:hypothetical protein